MAPLFDYKGLLPTGKSAKGIVDAESVRSARLKLKGQGVLVTDIKERKNINPSSVKKVSFIDNLLMGFNIRDIAQMTKQLANMIKANIPVVESLAAVLDQTENPKLKLVLSQVRQDVTEGMSLAKALASHPKAFDNIFISMIEAGESSGNLNFVLLKLAELKETQARLKSKIVSAILYPALTLVIAFVLLLVIFIVAIPKVTKIFEAQKVTLPLITRIMIFCSDLIINYWYLGIALMAGCVTLFNVYIKTARGRLRWDRFRMQFPVIGKVIRMVAVARFASTMGALLQSGVPILTGLAIAKNIVDNVPMAQAIQLARENITEGQSIAQPLGRSKEFPPLMIHMIAIGEKTGDLPEMLLSVAETYEEQVNESVLALTGAIQPLMIVVMGGIIGSTVFAIFLPLMGIMNTVKR